MRFEGTITRADLLSQEGFIASIGLPGAGKSTFFDNLLAPSSADDKSHEWLRLERDRFREAMFGGRQAFWSHPMDVKVKSAVIRSAMRASLMNWPHLKWCLTDTGTEQTAVNPFVGRANICFRNERGDRPLMPVTLIVFEQPLEVLIERNRNRPEDHRVTEELLTERYEATYGPDAWWRRLDTGKTKRTKVLRPEQIV